LERRNLVDHPRHGSYHSQIYEAYKAVKKLGLTISFTDQTRKNIKIMKGIDYTIFYRIVGITISVKCHKIS
jgi:hypothetical protein